MYALKNLGISTCIIYHEEDNNNISICTHCSKTIDC
jgi:hypothetical protein